jgi:hypothetical protein
MATLSYQIFNKHTKLSNKVINEFIKELNTLFSKFKNDKDIDNLHILKNKLLNLVEENKTNVNKKEIKIIKNLIDKFDDFLDEENQHKEKSKLIDVVSEVEKNYKKCDTIENNKRKKYSKYCVKKKKIKYEKELITLQVELLKLQNYIKESGEKLLIIFEGRDAA